MRIRRDGYGGNVRTRKRRGGGCMSLAVLIVLIANVGLITVIGIDRFGSPFSSSNSDPLTQAQQAFQRGDLDSAIGFSREVLTTNPTHADALTLLVRALVYRSYADYNHVNDRQIAVRDIAEALRISGGEPALRAAHAFALQANGQATEAAAVAEDVLAVEPNNALARTALGLAYARVGSFDRALRESNQAAQLDTPYKMDALRAVAIAHSDLGDYNNALLSVDAALSLNNRLLPLHFERALYAIQQGNSDDATVSYFNILAFDDANVKARLRLCELSSLLRERDAAISYCEEVTTRAPEWSEGWYHLGREYFLQGDYANAQTHLNRCSSLQIAQNVPVIEREFDCWYLQGQAAEILGDCMALISTYREFQTMAAQADIAQTWTYPPEGPPGCTTPGVPTPPA